MSLLKRNMIVLLLVFTAFGGVLVSAQDMPVAKIGIMVPLTGAYGADAEDVVQAAQIAVDDLNEAGGVAGYTLELVIADTVDQRADAVTTAFNQLSNTEDLNFIMTAYASTSNFEIDLMAEVDMPYLISANAAQTRDIVSADPEKYHTVWSRVPSYDAYETALPELLEAYDEAGLLSLRDREAFIISSDDPYGTTIATGMRAQFESLGWSIVGYETVPVASVTDWRGLLAKVRENEPDILVVTDSAPPNNAALMNQFMENPPNSLLFLQYGPSVQEFLDLTGDNSTGLIYNNLGAAIDSKPEVNEIRDRYEELHGHRGGYFTVIAYDQVMIYATCLEEVGDPADRIAIGDCIGGLEMETLAGFLTFDQETHLAIQGPEFYPIQFYQIWEGERIQIEPDKYATGTFQVPPWMDM
ncbi:MAG: ABC transporter substrate-binding protein [Chloroflexi bacterium]|nr:ABC transporter substrate-binding protein [Chloroflexota bacterium]